MDTLDPLIRRMGFLVEIAKRKNGLEGRLGKTAMQKLIYFLQEVLEVDLGYRFQLYTYGPYAAAIMDDIDYAAATDLLSVTYDKDKGYEITPGSAASELKESCQNAIRDAEPALGKLFDRFGELTARQLELRATLAYVARGEPGLSKETILSRVLELKPRYDRSEIDNAYDELYDGKLLPQAPGE